ncbi:MAG TPA: hypothetical protein VKS60_15985 [Stellaceae bacterium]|nr:hypothetical protein [Stellaceae bacterium]
MRPISVLPLLAVLAVAAPADEPKQTATAAAGPPPGLPAALVPRVLTGKERLSDKASDEQRVDDCKVPPERRSHPRPTACPWDSGS